MSAGPTTGLDPLIRDMLEWIGQEPRSYTEVMEAWRTSCPRLTVWEDALERGLVSRERGGRVAVTAEGYAFLRKSGLGKAAGNTPVRAGALL